jgi:hypothetical protein
VPKHMFTWMILMALACTCNQYVRRQILVIKVLSLRTSFVLSVDCTSCVLPGALLLNDVEDSKQMLA